MSDRHYDVVIIGAGTAGLSAERSARRAGASTLIIDERFAGTTCATVGCMPSKLLIAAAKASHAARQASTFGIHPGDLRIDGKAVLQRVRKLRDEFVSATLKSIDELPPQSRLRGTARFTDRTVLDVDGECIRAGAIVIATGSYPAIPATFKDLDHILTNETIFELKNLPDSLAVIGAGPLGLELAQAFSRLGVDVAVFDESDTVAGLKDKAVSAALKDILTQEMPLHLGVSTRARQVQDGVEISWSSEKHDETSGTKTFSHVLVATGRPPNLNRLDLAKTGLALDKHGTPVFDRSTMQCGASPIFLAGDADADAPVLHEASAEGAIAGHNAARFPAITPSRRTTRLAIAFTDPPAVTIGVAPPEDALIGKADYADQGRARAEGRNAGLARIYADVKGRLTGAAMAAPEAEHMAHLIAWAIEKEQTAADLLDLPIYHPTFEEGLRNALRQICAQAKTPVGDDRDEGTAPGT